VSLPSNHYGRGVVITFMSALVVAGCTTLIAGRYDYNLGWREGRVTHVGRAESIGRAATFDCRERMYHQGSAARNFARVIYSNSRHVLSAIVPIPNDVQLKVGDKVVVKKNSCDEPLVTNLDSRKGE